MTCKNIYEFILWDNCNNHCSFCPQREICVDLSTRQKIQSIYKMREFIDSDKYIDGSHILLVGGEIFDDVTPELKDCWWDTINYLGKKMNNKHIDLLYVNTNLLYKDLTLLNYLFDIIHYYGLWDRLKFTTSYDLEGRFANKSREQLFLENLKQIKEKYPDCKIVANTILTNKTCESILDGSFNPKKFCDEYDCDINLIPYIIYDKELSASPDMIFKTLIKTNELIEGYLKRYHNNLNLEQDKLVYRFNNTTHEFEYCSSKKMDCGHSENFKKYSNGDKCFICSLNELVKYMDL